MPTDREIVLQARKFRNVNRGWRAEDRTTELNGPDQAILEYETDLKLKLFELLDEQENAEEPREPADAAMDQYSDELTRRRVKGGDA